MSSTEMRELTQTDLELISGGVIEGYKWCWDGPAGDGAYPNYVDCGPRGATYSTAGRNEVEIWLPCPRRFRPPDSYRLFVARPRVVNIQHWRSGTPGHAACYSLSWRPLC